MKLHPVLACALLICTVGVHAEAPNVAAAVSNETRFDHGRFKEVRLYRPTATPRSFALLLSGDGGWNEGEARLAQTLVAEGALVAGIDTAQFMAELETDGGDCASISGDLENLSHYAQAYAHVPGYLLPIVVGYSAGATLAYANLLQSPPGLFASALTLGFCPDLELRKPLCAGESLRFTRRADGKGVDLLAEPSLKTPIVALYGSADPLCDIKATQAFIDRMPSASQEILPGVGHNYGDVPQARTALAITYRRLAATAPITDVSASSALSDLPIIEERSTATTEQARFAVLISGDGGWAGLDKDVSAALRAKGISVVGVDSLRYFWTERTPQGIAADLDRIVEHYSRAWNKSEVILIGYSQGADVLPFALTRLSAASRKRVVLAAAMGLSDHAVFKFQLTNWIADNDNGPETLPEVRRIRDLPFLCIYGAEEDDSICPQLKNSGARLVRLPGGHHFDGDYDALADAILSGLAGGSAATKQR